MGAWNYGYGALNRLSTATTAANAPAPYAGNYGCRASDAFGNRTAQSISTTSCASSSPLTSWASYSINNRFTNTNRPLAASPAILWATCSTMDGTCISATVLAACVR